MPTLERPNPQQPYPEPVYPRRPTRTVAVGEVLIGSQHPVVVQSMINEDVLNIDAAVAAIRRLHEAGSEIVRVAVPSLAHAKAMEVIRERLIQTYKPVPLVADVHHNGLKVALEVAKYVDKVRINPGLFVVEKPQPGRTEYTKAELEAIRSEIREAFVPPCPGPQSPEQSPTHWRQPRIPCGADALSLW
jgi:(E)-4-hydroxy-3-methylbut-2-enyl-diphosphate synthase